MDLLTSNICSASDNFPRNITVDDILHNANKLRRFDRPTLYIWDGCRSGDAISPLIKQTLPERPQLACSEYLECSQCGQEAENVFYIVAGIGIVCNKKAYEEVKQLDLNLQWSDHPMSFQDQILLFWSLGLACRKAN